MGSYRGRIKGDCPERSKAAMELRELVQKAGFHIGAARLELNCFGFMGSIYSSAWPFWLNRVYSSAASVRVCTLSFVKMWAK